MIFLLAVIFVSSISDISSKIANYLAANSHWGFVSAGISNFKQRAVENVVGIYFLLPYLAVRFCYHHFREKK